MTYSTQDVSSRWEALSRACISSSCVRRNRGLRHGVGFETCGPLRCNEHARRPTSWHVVFCEKMKNQVRNGGGCPSETSSPAQPPATGLKSSLFLPFPFSSIAISAARRAYRGKGY